MRKFILRDQMIYALYKLSYSQAAIAKAFHLGAARTHQLIKREQRIERRAKQKADEK